MIKKTLFIFLFLLQLNYVQAQVQLDQGISAATLRNGNLAYPPSLSFSDVLLRSGYLSQAETQEFMHSNSSLYWMRLAPYYTVQRNNTSCSLATATMILNCILEIQHPGQTKVFSQNEVLEQVGEGLWNFATTDEGPGVTLDQYFCFLQKMLATFGVEGAQVERIFVENLSPDTVEEIHADLLAIADHKATPTFLLADFEDAIYLGIDLYVGHISPVGGYDPEKQRVLIMDTDRLWNGPYWISEATFLQGMNTLDQTEGLTRPTYRGYIKITLPAANESS